MVWGMMERSLWRSMSKARNAYSISQFLSARCHVSSATASPATSAIRAYPLEKLYDDSPSAPLAKPALRHRLTKPVKPFSDFLTDTFSRHHDYLRISVTERCNLRCTYCMPEEGVPLSPPSHLLTSPEIIYLSSLFVSEGVTKIRLTGGEPTIRHDIVPLMRSIGDLRRQGLRELCITTNGIALHRKLDSMAEAGLTGVNLSLDTLDPLQFQIMTRRKGFEAVMKSMNRIVEMNRLGAGIKLKINCVIMRKINEREIIPFVELSKEKDVEVRFIEYMPFEGNRWNQEKMISYKEMLGIIRSKYPELQKVLDHKNNTSKTYKVPGFVGTIGFITSMTHHFCGSCNRLRITSDGNLKVCLFGNAEVSLRDLIRKQNGGQPIDEEAMETYKKLKHSHQRSLIDEQEFLNIGERERELLQVIGQAVKRKKERHAGMGQLENMKNRPMILIDDITVDAPSGQPPKNLPLREKSLSSFIFSRGLPLASMNMPSLENLYPRPHVTPKLSTYRLYSTSSTPLPASITSKLAQNHPITTSKNPPASLPHLTDASTVHVIPISHKTPTARSALAIGHVTFSNPNPLPLIRAHALQKGDVLAVARIAAITAAKKTSDWIPLCHSGVPIEGIRVRVEVVDGDVDGNSQEKKPITTSSQTLTSSPPHTSADADLSIPSTPPPSSSNSNQIPTPQTSTTSPLPSPSPAAANPGPSDEDPSTQTLNNHLQTLFQTPLPPYGGIRISVRVDTTAKTGVEMEALVGVIGAGLAVVDMCKGVDRGLVLEGVRAVWKRGGKGKGGGGEWWGVG